MESALKIEIIKGDITQLKVDAIVNAANSSLLGGGGVDGAIHRAGGPSIVEACRKIVENQGYCKTGKAVITTAGNLPAKFVIHTVGPIWTGGKACEEIRLAECYKNSLQLAVDNDVKTIAFPGISTGVYGFPKESAARISVDTIIDFLNLDSSIEKVYLVCYNDDNYALTKKYFTEKLNSLQN
jgi:O-acetyl-ADP-ribose deacetylase (regulator of RNase III)